jgi:histone deacetylase 6
VPDKTQPIRVVIFGIVNPNANSAATDSLKIIVKPLTSIIYDESNSAAAQLSFFPAPGWSPLNSIQVTTQAVRLTALYNFTFTTNSKVPKQNSEGALIFDFPKQYTIADGTAPCVTLSDFAPLPTCTFYRNRVTIVGNYKDYLGSLYVQIQNVSNPDNEGLTDYFYIRTYDGLNTMIIERNFANLDPFQFDFYYPGPLIKVNNDEHVYVERGTQIIGVPVTVEFPSVLNLQLSPTIQPPFIISPSNIQLPLGVTKTFINISVPQSLMDGVYPVYWTITGELSPPLYTPVARTYLHVTAT